MYGSPREHLEFRTRIVLNKDKCVGCALCVYLCPMKTVLALGDDGKARCIRRESCAGCMKCLDRCPAAAISVMR